MKEDLILQEQPKGKVVTPLGDYSYISHPINQEKWCFATDEELDKLGKHELKWAYEEDVIQVEVDNLKKPILENEIVVGYEKKTIDKIITKCSLVENDNTSETTLANAREELAEIKKWFERNDWKPNKVITGEWLETDKRWLEYKQERAIKRARQDELNTLLGNE
jgi:hypothetical protein